MSEELTAGKLLGMSLCDGGIVLYRDSQGKPHAQARHCKHMGPDLSLGDVIGDNLRCAFHHWEYGTDGVCNRLATSDKIPPQARLASFPTEESWGLIWVFWGLDPLYDLPSFHPALDMSAMIRKAYELPLKAPLLGEPWVMGMNAFDYQHLIALHGLPEHQPNYNQVIWNKYTIERPTGLIHHGFGANASFNESKLLNLDTQTAYLSARAPIGEGGYRRFFVEVVSIGDGSPEARKRAEDLLEYKFEHHTRVVDQDVDVLNSLDPSEPGLLVKSDSGIMRYLKWAAEYPMTTMAELIQQAEDKGLSQTGGSRS